MWRLALTLLLALLSVTSAGRSQRNEQRKRGVLVTVPRVWYEDIEQKICVTFYGIDFDVDVTTYVNVDADEESVVTSDRDKATFNQGTNGCFMMMIPKGFYESGLAYYHRGQYQASLQFRAEATENSGQSYEFSDEAEINVKTGDSPRINVTFIETDKPLYKPGDKVQFRALTVDSELKSRTEMIPIIYVENPQRTRVRQWNNISVSELQGFAEMDFHLSKDTTLGNWKISLIRDDGLKQTKSFNVDEYVLPKFEVKITAPGPTPIFANSTKAKVCAEYTYGEPVKGLANISVCSKPPYYSFHLQVFSNCWTFQTDLHGCHEFDIPVQTLLASDVKKHRVPYGLKLAVNATVTEEGTGVSRNASAESPEMTFKVYKVELEGLGKYFKPGLPYEGVVSVKEISGKPVVDVEVLLKLSYTEGKREPQQLKTDKNGKAPFVLTDLAIEKESSYVIIQADVTTLPDFGPFESEIEKPYATKSVKSWFSPSDAYILIDEITEKVPCGGRIQAHLIYTNLGENLQDPFNYQIVIGNSIVSEGQVAPPTGSGGLDLELALPEDSWGSGSLIVHYILPDGEIVAESAEFERKRCSKNKVTMQFGQREVFPGDDISLEIAASPGSLCAYGVVDESVQLLSDYEPLTMDKVYSKFPSPDDSVGYRPVWGRDRYCENYIKEEASRGNKKRRKEKKKNRQGSERSRRPRMIIDYPGTAYSNYVDSSEAFKDSDVEVMTNLVLYTKPCIVRVPLTRRLYAGQKGDSPEYSYSFVDEDAMPGSPGMALQGPDQERVAYSEVHVGVDLDDNIQLPMAEEKVRSFFPETWLWDILPVGPQGEIVTMTTAPDTITEWEGQAMCTNPDDGLGISEPASLRTFQPFFVSLTLPYSAIRGETIQMPVSVFNYLSECLVVELELEPSEDYRLEGGSASRRLCVCGQEKETQAFPVTALKLGHINVTIKAESVENPQVCGNALMSNQIGVRDKVIRELLVEAEGKEAEFSHSAFICPQGSRVREMVELTLPDDVIPDSVRGYISVMGDVMGPVLSGLDSLLKLPTGCGEQNMLKFAPNIFILQYLTNTDQLTPELEKKALDYLQIGYERELQYRHSDGSYSAFGSNDDEGSTWLTAFVLKSFHQAKEFIEIDEDDLTVTWAWFVRNQLENGCFASSGRVLHKSMKGGLASDHNTLAPLTAYSLIALIEGGQNPESPVVHEAATCLAVQEYSDAYTTALVSYALSLWQPNSELTETAFDKLNQLKQQKDGNIFWSGANSAGVETTAYALLAYLTKYENPLDHLDELLPIVRWLTAQRNPNGGFYSTQDTVVALQALAKFASILSADGGSVSVKAHTDLETYNFRVNQDNRLLLQTQAISVPSSIRFDVRGKGCAYLQASMLYNIANVTSGSTPSISIDVTPRRTEDNDCRRRELHVCLEYEGPDEQTNMALLDVKMVTGWMPVEETVEQLMQETTLNLGRYEVEKKNVYLYFNELLRHQKVCLSFEVVQDIEVNNAKPGSATVFDYYDKEEVFFQKEYILKTICGTKEELPFHRENNEVDSLSQQRQPVDPPPGPRNQDETTVQDSSCPVCYDETPQESIIAELICQTPNVYKGMVKKPGQLKMHRNLVSKEKVGRTVEYLGCSCDLLVERGRWFWMITNDSVIQEEGKKKGSIRLTSADIVIPVDKRSKALDRLLKKTKKSKQCRGN